jgi:hypothetical protein
MDNAAAMAEASKRYCALIEMPPPDDADKRRRELVAALARLVASAALLEEPHHMDLTEEREAKLPFDKIRQKLAWIPWGLYYDLCESCLDTSKEPKPLIGDVFDDLSDIYRDVSIGLLYWEAGAHSDAQWYWCAMFRSHWQYHAASAIYALTHAASNAP